MPSPFNSINLASQPFRRERAQNAVYVLACAGLAVSLLVLTVLISRDRAEVADLRRNLERHRAELAQLQSEQSQFSIVLGKPQNADVFATSVFLNELIARRSVSWTRVFSDLETVMPSSMKLMTVRLPQVGAPDSGGVNHVQLDMIVGTTQPAVVIELLKKLQESSKLFGAAAVVNQQPPSQNDPLYRYRITVAYAQSL